MVYLSPQAALGAILALAPALSAQAPEWWSLRPLQDAPALDGLFRL